MGTALRREDRVRVGIRPAGDPVPPGVGVASIEAE
jgi:hypothetical protein